MADKSVSRAIAEFAVGLTYEKIPEDAIKEAKRFLFDSLGCAFGAYDVHDVQIMRDLIHEMGGSKECSIFGSGEKTNTYLGSFLNSLMIRAMDYNDIYWKEDPSHPSDIIPAPLSLAEQHRLSGKDLLVGIILAYEIEMRLCEFAKPGIRERKWHHASLTQFASPVAAGKMLALSVDEMVNAIGISACHNFTPGAVTAGKLTMMKNTVDPMATQSGVLAALMAKKGYIGTEAIFEGKEGFADTFGGEFDLDLLTRDLGDNYRILECGMKAFPVEALSHSPMTAAIRLCKEHDIHPDDVKGVLVKTTARAKDILADPTKYIPSSKETADHSLPYTISVSILDRMVTTAQFKDEKLKDPKVYDMMQKVKVEADEEIEKAFPELKTAIVEIETSDGKTHSCRVDYPKGDYREPMSDDELREKFAGLCGDYLTEKRQQQIFDTVTGLEKHAVSDLMTLCVNDR